MGRFFYKLGRMVGPTLRKGKWVYESLTGSDADAIRAEYEVGRDLAQAFLAEAPTDPDAASQQFVDALGANLAGRVTNRQWRFSFRLMQAHEINAFALPGGFVFMNRPLLELCGADRDEVAFILGHEMGHVVHGHAMQRIVSRWALIAAGRTLPVSGMAGGVLLHQIRELLHKAYSRDQELDADRFGVRLAQAAGFDPQAAIRLLHRLQANSSGEAALSSYFSTHPPFEERVQAVIQYLGHC
jgi:predicted Zn-dependent protease